MKIVKGLRQDLEGNDVTSIYPNMPEEMPVEQILFSACVEAHPSVIFNIETDVNGKPCIRDNGGNWHSPDDAREMAKALLIAADISEGKEPRNYDEHLEIPERDVLLNACETVIPYFSRSSYYRAVMEEAVQSYNKAMHKSEPAVSNFQHSTNA